MWVGIITRRKIRKSIEIKCESYSFHTNIKHSNFSFVQIQTCLILRRFCFLSYMKFSNAVIYVQCVDTRIRDDKYSMKCIRIENKTLFGNDVAWCTKMWKFEWKYINGSKGLMECCNFMLTAAFLWSVFGLIFHEFSVFDI